MKLLVFSDVHADLAAARALVRAAEGVDAVLGAGDYGVQRERLAPTIRTLEAVRTPALLVSGNAESPDELRTACLGWTAATVLHGEARAVGGLSVFGLGGAPTTPWDWSFDLAEEEFATHLEGAGADVWLLHAPPFGCLDGLGTKRFGSRAVRAAVEARRPRLVVCGHIHECAGREERIGPTRVVNAGPAGLVLEV